MERKFRNHENEETLNRYSKNRRLITFYTEDVGSGKKSLCKLNKRIFLTAEMKRPRHKLLEMTQYID